jgi:hypothetical protein
VLRELSSEAHKRQDNRQEDHSSCHWLIQKRY